MLKGQAKTDYQRDYMREYQRQRRGSKQGLNIGSKQDVKTRLNQLIKSMENKPPEKMVVPPYNPSIHKPGDRVMVNYGKKMIETVIPELDDDGNPMTY